MKETVTITLCGILLLTAGYWAGWKDASAQWNKQRMHSEAICVSYIDIEGNESLCEPIPEGSTGWKIYAHTEGNSK